MKHVPSLLISSFLFVPIIGIAGGDTDAVMQTIVPTAANWTATSVTSDSVRPSWLPDRPVFPASGTAAGGERPTFNTIDRSQLSGECSDPALSDIAFVMLQRLGVCPASKLSTRL
jgi:hypothetical protein